RARARRFRRGQGLRRPHGRRLHDGCRRFQGGCLPGQAAAAAGKARRKDQAMLDDLKTRDAASFDKAYVEAQVQALREIVDLFRTYATVGDNARIKAVAQDLLLTIRSNLDDASKLR